MKHNGVSHEVIPGGLSEADQERIFALAERGWKRTRIARAIKKHPSTVGWFMYRNALIAPKYGRKPSLRGGRIVNPFTPEEDAFIRVLRVQNFGPTKIAELATKRFGHPRSMHTIACRLVMLAAQEELHGR
jgi:hypothetical protein